jgi:VWFA-related protein
MNCRRLDRTASIVLFCAVCGAFQFSPRPRALTTGTQDQPRPTFRTEANYVRVDAYPSRNGAPIPDLTREDFEILENGQPQQIDQFERVVVRAAGPEETRIEPNTVAESRAMLQSPRTRVFVLFLDTNHVDVAASHQIRRPLTDLLNKMLGPDDLIAVMTPEMSPLDMAFARKTTTIEGFLERYWPWGERDRANPVDPEDQKFGSCYPNVPAGDRCADQNGVAAELIDRRREVRTLGAIEDLVRHLRGVREERKAILSVSNGWLLFKPNPRLMRPLNCEGVPTQPPVEVDPRTGKLSTKKQSPEEQLANNTCSIDRLNLAQVDDDRLFRDIQDEANRANASFYTIDPRGLAAFDTPIVRQDVPGVLPPPTPPSIDQAMLRGRIDSLRTLAETTDGMAIVNTNDLSGGMRRIVNDLSAYYLLGYYSNGKLDGKFHSITVRVKRPGVQVRARRGYLAATAAGADRTGRAKAAGPNAPSSAKDTEAVAVESALKPLGSFNKETSVRLRAAAGWKGPSESLVWLVGEVGLADAWRLGAQADVTLTLEGQTLASAQVKVPPGSRHFRVLLTPNAPLQPGDYSVNVRTSATSQLATTADLVSLAVEAAPAGSGSLIYRRGPFTGLKDVPTADLRFRRSEQMRIEIPTVAGTASGSAALLDRTGKAMAVPLTVLFRDDPDGSRWATTQVPLVPLGPGDYLVEMTVGGAKTLTPFRMVQ